MNRNVVLTFVLVLGSLTMVGTTAQAENTGLYFGGGFGGGHVDFVGIDDPQTGWGLSLSSGVMSIGDELVFDISLLLQYLNTTDDSSGKSITTTATGFFGTIGLGLALDEDLGVYGRGGLGVVTRGVDNLPDDEQGATTKDQGFGAIAGLGAVFFEFDSGGVIMNVDYVYQLTGVGSNYTIATLNLVFSTGL